MEKNLVRVEKISGEKREASCPAEGSFLFSFDKEIRR
jgi:hypothetical protein